MMGRKSGQIEMLILNPEDIIPQSHILRKIDRIVSFEYIYELLEPTYSETGRPSIDPVSLVKMLLIGYLFGIKSERRLVNEVALNIAYRWFCGFNITDSIPDHSTFSKNRISRWKESNLFEKVFVYIVQECIRHKLVDGDEIVADGTYIPANVAQNSWVDVETKVELSMQSYLNDLDAELAQQPGFKAPLPKEITKTRTTSTTDPDCGYMNHGTKHGVGYLAETTVDSKHGIITGMDVYPANEKESLIVLRHLEKQMSQADFSIHKLALDRGYDTGAVHRGLEMLGITGYIPEIHFPNSPEKYGFRYDENDGCFICPVGNRLTYYKLVCNQSTGKYLRCYQIQDDRCLSCSRRSECFSKTPVKRKILASSCYPAFFRGHKRIGTKEYYAMMRKRKIWSEGSFSVLKREHLISKIRKRGILCATEECLLAAMALNLKRMARAILSSKLFSFRLRVSMCCS